MIACLYQPPLMISVTLAAASRPRSERISASSISSSMAGSIGPFITMSVIAVPSADDVRLSPPARRPNQPCFLAGFFGVSLVLSLMPAAVIRVSP